MQDCKECDCDAGGSTERQCDKETGACQCRLHINGRQCSQPDPAFYVPSIDAFAFKPTSSSCRTRVDLARRDITGGQFLLCNDSAVATFDDVSTTLPQPNITW